MSALTVVANPDSVLSAELRFTTSPPATTTLHVQGPGDPFNVKAELSPVQTHDVPVVGLRAQSTYTLWVTENDSAGARTNSAKVTFTTAATPSDLPSLTTTSQPQRMAPGVTLFTATLRLPPAAVAAGQPGPMLGNLIAVDGEGQIVWYHRTPLPIGDARILADGHILYEYNDMGAHEIDILGHLVHEWAGRLELGRLAKDEYGRTIAGPNAIPVDIDSVHHEINQLPDGDFLAISTELRTVSGFTKPLCGDSASTFNGSYQLITDVVVEFRPDTGEVVHRWPVADYLHPQTNPSDANICGFPGATIVPNFLYTALGDVHDWTHVNAAIFDKARNAILVSIRHLDTVLAIRYQADSSGPAGALVWRLGPNGDFTLTGSGLWQYYQHAIEAEPDGSITLYDNGDYRPGTDATSTDPAEQPFSRAVRYLVNDTGPKSQWTVTQAWEYRPSINGVPVYAFFVGDADRLANGDVLVDSGGITDHPSGVNAQVVEIVPPTVGDGGDTVFDLRVIGPHNQWFVYRADRVPSLYGPLADAAQG